MSLSVSTEVDNKGFTLGSLPVIKNPWSQSHRGQNRLNADENGDQAFFA